MKLSGMLGIAAVVAVCGITITCNKDSGTTVPQRTVVFSEGFEEANLSDAGYMQVTYATGQGMMSISTNAAHSGKSSLTSDSNNTGIRKSLNDAISDSIAGLEFYLMAKKAEHINFFAAIARPGSSANGLFTIMGIGIDKSDSLKYIYENEPGDSVNNEHKNFAALVFNKWYKCNIEYDFTNAILSYYVDGTVVYTKSAPNPMSLQMFVAMRDSSGSQGVKGYYIDDVTIYKR